MKLPDNIKPGDAIEGGFFAGIIAAEGRRWGLAVAPKAEGEFNAEWGNYGTKIEGAISHFDGQANTAAMAAANSPAAIQVQALEIAGYKDWYIPAVDEKEVCYRNLKPSPDENWCSYRDGANPSSESPAQPYTEFSPAQTSVAAFRAGGAEAFDLTWYWTSTQYSAHDAHVQDFKGGCQDIYGKVNPWRVRAVRRFLID